MLYQVSASQTTLLSLFLLFAGMSVSHGQQAPAGATQIQPPPSTTDISINTDKHVNIDATSDKQVGMPPSSSTNQPRDWATIEIVLSVAMLVFGMLIFVLQTYLIVKLNLQWTPTSILRFQGLTLIIVGAIVQCFEAVIRR